MRALPGESSLRFRWTDNVLTIPVDLKAYFICPFDDRKTSKTSFSLVHQSPLVVQNIEFQCNFHNF